MHYDLQPMALPLCLLLAAMDRLHLFWRVLIIGLSLALGYCAMDLAMGLGSIRIPFETFIMLALWLVCGVLTVSEAIRPPFHKNSGVSRNGESWESLSAYDSAVTP
jgi:hypothetical protein